MLIMLKSLNLLFIALTYYFNLLNSKLQMPYILTRSPAIGFL